MSVAEYDPYQGRNRLKWHVEFNLIQPLSHISETTGNESLLKTAQMVGIDGQTVQVPIYSGNAQRNGNMGRRTGIGSFLDALELSVNQATHQTLYSGGYIEGSTINDFDWESRVRKFLPQLSLLGGAVPPGVLGMAKGKSQMLEGRINIGDAYLVCAESLPYLWEMCPALIPWECYGAVEAIMVARRQFVDRRYDFMERRCTAEDVQRAHDHLKTVERQHLPIVCHYAKPASEHWEYRESVRIPSVKQPELRRHLAGAAPVLAGDSADAGEKKPKKEAGRQMISGAWVIQRGATLYARWATRGQGVTELEEGSLVNTLLEFAKKPYIGGKGNSGCGLVSLNVRIDAGQGIQDYLTLSESAQVVSDRAADCHRRYLEMVQVYADHVAELKAGTTADAQGAIELLTGG